MDKDTNLTTEYHKMRQAQCLQVFMLKAEEPETTIEDACDRVGITRSQYYYWLKKDDSAIHAFRTVIQESQREQLATIVLAKAVAIQKLVNAVISDGIKTKDRVAALKYLDSQAEELQTVHHARPGIEEDARRFLKEGPHTENKASKIGSLEIRAGADGSAVIDIMGPEQEILDVPFADHEQDEPPASTRNRFEDDDQDK